MKEADGWFLLFEACVVVLFLGTYLYYMMGNDE